VATSYLTAINCRVYVGESSAKTGQYLLQL